MAIAINLANVVGRYVFAAPVFWAEEVLMFMIIWGIYIAAGSSRTWGRTWRWTSWPRG